MLSRVTVLMSLVFASGVPTTFAADADVEAIKRAIVMDSAITREDVLKFGESGKPPKPTDLEDQSLTFMLVVFLGSDKEQRQADFRPLKEGRLRPEDIGNEIGRVRQIDHRLISYEPMTCIHLDRITDIKCQFAGNVAEGVVSFKVPGLYEGKAQFLASRHDNEWLIHEFAMPSLGIDLVRDTRMKRLPGGGARNESVWRQRDGNGERSDAADSR